MGEFVTLDVDRERSVATIRLDRPPHNALCLQAWDELGEAAAEAAADADAGAVVVWGGPRVFAVGADASEFPDWSFRDVRAIGRRLHGALDALARLPKVTIAAVNGHALGGGCEVALACDFRFAADSARFGQPEVRLGIIPGAGGTQRLPRLVGVARAKEMIFSGRIVDADEALAIGLVEEVAPADEVYTQAVERAAGYASGPYALRLAKQAIDEGVEGPLDQGLRLERTLFAECFGTDDARTGISSFLERGPGKAKFEGR